MEQFGRLVEKSGEPGGVSGGSSNFGIKCRLCMEFSMFLKPIFEEEAENSNDFNSRNKSETVVEMINLCTQLKINSNDDLPKFMCTVCMDELLRNNKFRKQCIKSDEQFRKILKRKHGNKNKKKDEIRSLDEIYDVDKIFDLKDNELNEIHARSSELFLFNPNQPELITSRDQNDTIKNQCEEIEDQVNYCQQGCNDENSSFRKYLKRKTSNDVRKLIKKQKWPHCNKLFSTSRFFKTNLFAHKKRKLDICDAIPKNTIKKHSTSVRSCQPILDSLEICENHRQPVVDVNKHQGLHLKIKAYRCDQCSKYFKANKILSNHRRVHEREKGAFKCWKCNDVFLLPTSYRQHMKSHNLSMQDNFGILPPP